ncbi:MULTISPECIES: hypothetical protein [Burkholderia]|uniref:hypothetical protein n=1 Tax=Burkholderia TaxID=32008 RepID=UPI0015E0E20D|nr:MULTISPECIES: hypothetical protein [unclassified Burkholderia]
MNEQNRLRHASIFSVVSLLCLVALVNIGPFPYPDVNLDGQNLSGLSAALS